MDVMRCMGDLLELELSSDTVNETDRAVAKSGIS